MSMFSVRSSCALLTIAMMTAALSCSAGKSQVLEGDGGSVCELNESVTAQGGSYDTNVDLTASIALPGVEGVDVVMTGYGAIAAVNTENGSALHWVDPVTGEIQQSVEFEDKISDIAFDGDRMLAIAINDRVVRLDAASGERVSEVRLPGVTRVAIASDGHVGAIAGKTVHLFDDNNTQVFSKLRDYTAVTDVEVLSCSGGPSLVYVTSFRNTSFIDLNDKRNPVQISRLEALNFAGDVQWSLFGDPSETIKQNVADTRLYRATMGRDGYLYIAGESAGTATIFRWRGQPMTPEEQVGRAEPFLTRIDENSLLHNSGAAHLPYYARVHPTDGVLVTSQMSFPRKSDKKANAMRLGDIASSANGTLFFGGAANASIPNRDELTLNGVPVGGYGGKDRAWMAIAPDFQTREFWTVLAAEGGRGMVQGVDAGYGYSAALSNVESGTVPVTTGEATGTVFLTFTATP